MAGARDAGYNVRRADADHIGLSLDETTRREDVQGVLRGAGVRCRRGRGRREWPGRFGSGFGSGPRCPGCRTPDVIGPLARTGTYLTHPVFHHRHSETEMLRYLRRLAAKDVALDRAMIPLVPAP